MSEQTQETRRNYPLIESTVEFKVGTYEVRAWFNETEIKPEYDNSAFKEVAMTNFALPPTQLAELLAALPRVNAVHIKTWMSGDGIVLYVNWP